MTSAVVSSLFVHLFTQRALYVDAGLDTGRVDPRVGSGRVEISYMDYFLSASVEFCKFNSPFTSRHLLLCER